MEKRNWDWIYSKLILSERNGYKSTILVGLEFCKCCDPRPISTNNASNKLGENEKREAIAIIITSSLMSHPIYLDDKQPSILPKCQLRFWTSKHKPSNKSCTKVNSTDTLTFKNTARSRTHRLLHHFSLHNWCYVGDI